MSCTRHVLLYSPKPLENLWSIAPSILSACSIKSSWQPQRDHLDINVRCVWSAAVLALTSFWKCRPSTYVDSTVILCLHQCAVVPITTRRNRQGDAWSAPTPGSISKCCIRIVKKKCCRRFSGKPSPKTAQDFSKNRGQNHIAHRHGNVDGASIFGC